MILRRFTLRTSGGPRDVEVQLGDQANFATLLEALKLESAVDDYGRALDGGAPAGVVRSGSVLGKAPDARFVPVAKPELWVVAGAASGQRFRLHDGDWLVGRSRNADFAILDPTVSDRHAELHVRGGAVELFDVASSNGTFVDGVELVPNTPCVVTEESVVRLGDAAVFIRQPVAADGVVSGESEGRPRFNVTPRRVVEPAVLNVTKPGGPRRSASRASLGSNLAMSAVTAAGMLVLALVMRRPEMLAFGLLAPIQFVATGFVQRRRQIADDRVADSEAATKSRSVDAQISDFLLRERDRLEQAFPNMVDLAIIASGPSSRLWERPTSSKDYLDVRIGIGNQPSKATIRDDDGVENPRLADAPIVMSLDRDRVLGIDGPSESANALARWIVAQTAVLQSPASLTIAVLSDPAGESAWGWTRWLPHVALDESLAIAVDQNQTTSLLGGLLSRIDSVLAESSRSAGGLPPVTTLVIVDRPHRLAANPQLARLYGEGPLAGIAILSIAGSRQEQRAECSANLGFKSPARLDLDFLGGADVDDPIGEFLPIELADRIARDISWLEPATSGNQKAGGLAYPLRVEEVGISCSEDAVARGWESAPSPTTFAFGRTEGGIQKLDLGADGPHFLVAGTAGSGKSELLQAMLAGMATAARPDELNFALVDFKGGACFGPGVDLPHTTSKTFNLDGTASVERAVRLLRAELDWRQRQFAEIGEKCKSLGDYQAMRRPDQPNIPRLVVVLDEFAQFVSAIPKADTAFVEIGRIGRSLGVHLIIATQSPRNCVSPDLRSNVQTVVGLRTANEIESNLLIGGDECARLSARFRGRGFVKSPNEPLTLFQGAWIGIPVGSRDSDHRVLARELTWRGVGTVPVEQPAEATDVRTEFDDVVRAMRAAWTKVESSHAPLRSALPPELPKELLSHTIDFSSRGTLVALGLEDDLAHQDQPAVGVDLAAGRHLLIAGSPTTGRTNALVAVLQRVEQQFPDGQCEVHVIDLGTTRLGRLSERPLVGTVVVSGDEYLASALINTLAAEARRRENADVGASPIVVLVDNGQALYRLLDTDSALRLAWESVLDRGRSVGITVIMTGDENLGIREVLGRFDERWLLTFSDENAYIRFGLDARDTPEPMPNGRALNLRTGNVVQIVKAALAESAPAVEPRGTRPKLRRLPEQVSLSEIRFPRTHALSVGIGLGGGDAAPTCVDLATMGPAFLVAGPPRSGRSTLMRVLAETLSRNGVEVVVAHGRRSPLAQLSGPGITVVGGSIADAKIETSPAVLLVDDAATVVDEQQLDQFFQDGNAVVVSLRWDDARGIRMSSPFGVALRSNACGVVLNPVLGNAMTPLGVDFPRNLSILDVPGRGFLVDDGLLTMVQVGLP